MITAEGATTVLSGCVAASSPYFSIVERNDAGHWVLCKSIANRPLRRQDAPPVYDLNGAVYAWRRGVLGATNEVFNPDAQLYVMPPERGLDIDSHFDFVIAEALIARENG
ncbi:MAG: hypothetical protein HQ492_02250 [Woeseiaceae bacterium]|nr:hypothetical protein [Woeseiaceae bacterium]